MAGVAVAAFNPYANVLWMVDTWAPPAAVQQSARRTPSDSFLLSSPKADQESLCHYEVQPCCRNLTWICMCVCVCVMCVCVNSFTYACMYVYMYACMHLCMHACMSVCLSVCLYVCMHSCMQSVSPRREHLSAKRGVWFGGDEQVHFVFISICF